MEIIWSETALETYLKVIDYLFEKWTIKEIIVFEYKVDELLNKIKKLKQFCPESKILGYKKYTIDANNSVIHTISNNNILLITFLDNRSSNIF